MADKHLVLLLATIGSFSIACEYPHDEPVPTVRYDAVCLSQSGDTLYVGHGLITVTPPEEQPGFLGTGAKQMHWEFGEQGIWDSRRHHARWKVTAASRVTGDCVVRPSKP